MQKGIHIAELDAGMGIEGVFAVTGAERRPGKSGDYWVLTLADATGTMPGRVWSRFGRLEPETLPERCIARVSGTVTTYKDEKQARVDAIAPLSEQEEGELDPADFLRRDSAAEDNFAALMELARAEFTTSCWRRLVLGFFEDADNARAFTHASAAKTLHHDESGGLVTHTLEVFRLCRAAADIFPGLDRQALLAGAIFHDVGKLMEMRTGMLGTTYTSEGTLIGHLVLGVQALGPLCERAGLPAPLRRHLFHLLLSHHGTPEFGAVKEPMTAEAIILHHADMVSAHVNTCARRLRDVSPESESRGWGGTFFQPTRTADIPELERVEAQTARPGPVQPDPATAAPPVPSAAAQVSIPDGAPITDETATPPRGAGPDATALPHWGMDTVPEDDDLDEPASLEEIPLWTLQEGPGLHGPDGMFPTEGYDEVPDELPEDDVPAAPPEAAQATAGEAASPDMPAQPADDLPPFMLDELPDPTPGSDSVMDSRDENDARETAAPEDILNLPADDLPPFMLDEFPDPTPGKNSREDPHDENGATESAAPKDIRDLPADELPPFMLDENLSPVPEGGSPTIPHDQPATAPGEAPDRMPGHAGKAVPRDTEPVADEPAVEPEPAPAAESAPANDRTRRERPAATRGAPQRRKPRQRSLFDR